MARPFTQEQDLRIPGLPIDYRHFPKDNPRGLKVFLNSARVVREGITEQPFMRHTWAEHFPEDEVLVIVDPALTPYPSLRGAFYMHPEHDVVEYLADFIADFASKRQIARENITVYGSSYGGFAAIGVAAHLQGAKAVAECPQVDLEDWQPEMIQPLEAEIIGDIREHKKRHPEQVFLKERCRKANWIPAFKIITNPTEYRLDEQVDFFKWSNNCNLPKAPNRNLLITTLTRGHGALALEDALKNIEF